MLSLKLLGGVSLEGGSAVLTGKAAQRHRVALLALLAVACPRPLTRDKLVGYLWPENDARSARNLLSQAVHALRKALGPDAILASGDELRLNPERVGSDVVRFEEALAAGDRERAVELYAGPFLDGFFLDGSSEFEGCVEAERRRLREAYLRALEELADDAAARDARADAAAWWRRLAAEEPYNARVAIRSMEALAAAGDRAGAIRQAQTHAALLREEFDADPDPEVLALAERLKTQPPGLAELASVQPAHQTASSEPSPSIGKAPAELGEALGASSQSVPAQTDNGAGRRLSIRRVSIVAATVALVVATVALFSALRSRAGADPVDVASPTPVLLADFGGTTEVGYRDVARNIVGVVLDQSGFMSAVSREQMQRGLALTGRPATARVDDDLARELAIRGGIGSVVLGQVDRVGRTLVVVLRAESAEDGAPFAAQRTVAEADDDLIGAVESAALRLVADLTGHRERLAGGNPVGEVATPSLAAYLKFVEGLDALEQRTNNHAAIRALTEAIEHDPDFAAAWLLIGAAYRNVGDREAARTAFNEALRRPERLPLNLRLKAAGHAAWVDGDLRAAYRAFDDLASLYGSHWSWQLLGAVLHELGRYEEAAEAVTRGAGPFGLAPLYTANLVFVLLTNLGRHDEALTRIEELPPNLRARYRQVHALVTADWDSADSLALEASADVLQTPWPAFPHATRASAHAARGSARTADAYLAAAVAAAAARGGIGEVVTTVLARHLLALAAGGAAPSPIEYPRDGEDDGEMAALRAFEAVLHGDTATARALLGRLRQLPELDRRWLRAWPNLLEGMLLAREGRWTEASRVLHQANPGPWRDGRETPVVWWLRAEAYQRLGQPDSAAIYLAKLGDPQAVASVNRYKIGLAYAFAHQRLVVLYADMGHIDEARHHWRLFSETFTDPDPELRHLIDEAREALRQAERSGAALNPEPPFARFAHPGTGAGLRTATRPR